MWRFPEIELLSDIPGFWSKKDPRKTALRDGNLEINYKQLDESSSQIANRIIESGVNAGSNIGFVGRNGVEFFEAWFGACKAGCTLVPFNWRCSVQELMDLVDDAQTPLVFAEKEISLPKMLEAKELCQTQFDLVSFNLFENREKRFSGWADEAKKTSPNISVCSENIALLVYTSGTTGRPKAVRYDHQAFNYSFLCLSLEPEMAWGKDDVVLMVMPNFHLGGNWVPLPALYHGATITILPEFDPEKVMDTVVNHKCTVLPAVPTALKMLTDHPAVVEKNFSCLKKIYYFGSPVGIEDVKKTIKTFDCRINQLYGTTENWFCTLLTHDEHIADPPEHLTSCGKPLPLIGVKVCDKNGNELSDDEVGEIYIRTPVMSSVYGGIKKAGHKKQKVAWIGTGDLGKRNSKGFYFLVDRAKDMIISGGENIYSVEVERAMSRHEKIAQVAVIGTPDKKWGEKVVAFVSIIPGENVSENELIAHCKKFLAGYKVPKEIHFMESLPTTSTGKIQKNSLRAPYWQNSNRNIS